MIDHDRNVGEMLDLLDDRPIGSQLHPRRRAGEDERGGGRGGALNASGSGVA
jgi:hypothetical protein